MAHRFISRRLLTATLVLALAASVGCSKSDKGGPVTGPGPTPKELDSATLSSGAVYNHTFANAGAYPYHCKFHGGMTGTVQVSAGSPAMVSVSITDNAFNPASVSVAPGGSVTWTNNGGAQHTVTSD